VKIVFKKLNVIGTAKNDVGIVSNLLLPEITEEGFVPTYGLQYTLSDDESYYIIGSGFTNIATLESDTEGGVAGSGLNATWFGGNLYIPNSYNGKPVLAIAPKAFQDINNITNCYIQEGITHIGHRAFQKTSTITTDTLEYIELPNSLTFLGGTGGRVFYQCFALKTIDIKNVTYLGTYSFYKCNELQKIIGDSVLKTDTYVASYCTKLEEVSMKKAITIGDYAFMKSTNLTHVNLDSAITIGRDSFNDCDGMKNITLPSIESLGAYVFYYMSYLTDITIKQPRFVCKTDYSALSTTSTKENIFVPITLLESYKADTQWSAYADIIKPIMYNIDYIGPGLVTESTNSEGCVILKAVPSTGSSFIGWYNGFKYKTDADTTTYEQLDVAYPLQKIGAGYYKNTNQGVANSVSMGRFVFTTIKANQKVRIKYTQSSESKYDYGIIGNVDVALSTSNPSSEGYTTLKQASSSGTITLTVLSAGDHFIDIKYRKDGGGDKGTDTLTVCVEIPRDDYIDKPSGDLYSTDTEINVGVVNDEMTEPINLVAVFQ
jgi:hypothetical protein